jgi:alkylhydroperoxidase family enzyme
MDQTPRIQPLEAPYTPELAELLAAMMPPGVPPLALFRTLAKNPRVLGKIRNANLLDRGSIERREREIVILRTTARCRSEYEWGVHVAAFAQRFGLDPAQVAATASSHAGAAAPTWSDRDRLLIRLVDELHDDARVSDALWSELAAHYSESQLIELVVLTGFYHMISFVTNAFTLANEPNTPPFPSGELAAGV